MSKGNRGETDRGVGDRRFCRGQIVSWDGGGRYRVLRRRAVDGFAMFQTGGTHELFLVALDGGEGPGWVGEEEAEPLEE